jgi:hypothetical protein
MFFVALLLNAVTTWMRAQGGTASLRAILYMDEIFGFFPPIANPPSKLPLLTLLKQGRAAGVGVVLATQNPVDLDYKGLSNIGTWWLGRLQTDRDKARVLDGLEAAGATDLDRAEVDRLLSSLSPRVFLMRNVHDQGLALFHSRWALSYLRGPLGREEIRRLAGSPPVTPASRARDLATSSRPSLPPDVPQFFLATGVPAPRLTPALYGAAEMRFLDRKLKVDERRFVAVTVPVREGAVPVNWEAAEPIGLTPETLLREPPPDARFSTDVPSAASKAANYASWSKQLAAYLATNERIELLRSPTSGEISRVGETENDFRGRLQQGAREKRDQAIDALRRKYAPKQAALEEKLRRAKQALDREQEQASGHQLQTAISLGATLVGALLGRRSLGGTLGRATTAARGVGRSMKEREDVARAGETIDAVDDARRRLDDDLRADIAALETTAAATETLERITVRPKPSDVDVKLVALVWRPAGLS